MANIKLTDLTELTDYTIQNTIFLVSDLAVSPNVSHFMRLSTFTSQNSITALSFNQANLAYEMANVAYSTGYVANIAYNAANSAFAHAEGSYSKANSTLVYTTSSYGQANTGTVLAQSAYNKANAAGVLAQVGSTHANNAHNQANTGTVLAQSAYNQANTATSDAQNKSQFAFNGANNALNLAQSGYNKANTGITRTGDTITGVINVPTSANGTYTQQIATNQYVHNSMADFVPLAYRPGMQVQTTYNRIDTKSVTTFDYRGTFLPNINCSITPIFTTSKIKVEMNLSYEASHDSTLRLFRRIGTQINGTGYINGGLVTLTAVTGTVQYGTNFLVISNAPTRVNYFYITTQVSGTPGGAGVYNCLPFTYSNSSFIFPGANAPISFNNIGAGVGAPVGFPTTENMMTNYWAGTWILGYDVDSASTPRTNHFMYYDSLPGFTNNVIVPVTYSLMAVHSYDSGTFAINRSILSSGQPAYEVGISQVMLTETYSQ